MVSRQSTLLTNGFMMIGTINEIWRMRKKDSSGDNFPQNSFAFSDDELIINFKNIPKIGLVSLTAKYIRCLFALQLNLGIT